MGKWLSRFLMVVLLMMLFGIVFMVGSWHETAPEYGGNVILSLWVIATWGCLLLSFSLWVSNRTRNSLSAAALNFGGQFFFLLVIPMLLFATIGGSELDVRSVYEWERQFGDPNATLDSMPLWFLGWRMIYWLNPFVVLGEVFSDYSYYSPDTIGLLPGWGIIQGIYYVLGSAVLVWLTVRGLRRRNRKG